MEFYRNVKVERDATADQPREPQGIESLSDILGGTEPPLVPAPRPVVVATGDDDEPEEAEAADDTDDE
jgi:hypothetical protein